MEITYKFILKAWLVCFISITAILTYAIYTEGNENILVSGFVGAFLGFIMSYPITIVVLIAIGDTGVDGDNL